MLLNIHNLHVCVEEKPVLRGVSLELSAGDVHVIMGPNGSGKSTLANTLIGDPRYKITEGSCLFRGENLLDMPIHERAKKGMFLAFQHPVEIPGVSVQNFLRVAYEAKYGAVSSILDFRSMVENVAQTLGIEKSFLTRNMNEGFSGGEKKRMEVLQLAILKPSLAILDELDSGVDVDALATLAHAIHHHAQQNNTALLVITHHHHLLRFITPTHVHVMVNGTLVKTGDNALVAELEKDGYGKYTQA